MNQTCERAQQLLYKGAMRFQFSKKINTKCAKVRTNGQTHREESFLLLLKGKSVEGGYGNVYFFFKTCMSTKIIVDLKQNQLQVRFWRGKLRDFPLLFSRNNFNENENFATLILHINGYIYTTVSLLIKRNIIKQYKIDRRGS